MNLSSPFARIVGLRFWHGVLECCIGVKCKSLLSGLCMNIVDKLYQISGS